MNEMKVEYVELVPGARVLTKDGFVHLVLGRGDDDGKPVALIGAVYNVISEDHASIPNRIEYCSDLEYLKP